MRGRAPEGEDTGGSRGCGEGGTCWRPDRSKAMGSSDVGPRTPQARGLVGQWQMVFTLNSVKRNDSWLLVLGEIVRLITKLDRSRRNFSIRCVVTDDETEASGRAHCLYRCTVVKSKGLIGTTSR